MEGGDGDFCGCLYGVDGYDDDFCVFVGIRDGGKMEWWWLRFWGILEMMITVGVHGGYNNCVIGQ